MRTISVFNDKGGVGKTIIASLLADAALLIKKPDGSRNRVLVIDLDPQATLSRDRIGKYGQMPEEESIISEDDPSLANYLVQRGEIMHYIIGLKEHPLAPKVVETVKDIRLGVIWPGYNLTEVMERMDQFQTREGYESIEDWLEFARDSNMWDYCIIDNPPNRAGLSKRLALRSDLVVIPSLPDPFSFQATQRSISTIGSSQMLVVPNRYNSKTAIHREYLEELQRLRIPKAVEISETIPSDGIFISEQAQGMPVLLSRLSMAAVKATHGMIVRALNLPSKTWFYSQVKEAYEEYKPELALYQAKLDARLTARKKHVAALKAAAIGQISPES